MIRDACMIGWTNKVLSELNISYKVLIFLFLHMRSMKPKLNDLFFFWRLKVQSNINETHRVGWGGYPQITSFVMSSSHRKGRNFLNFSLFAKLHNWNSIDVKLPSHFRKTSDTTVNKMKNRTFVLFNSSSSLQYSFFFSPFMFGILFFIRKKSLLHISSFYCFV